MKSICSIMKILLYSMIWKKRATIPLGTVSTVNDTMQLLKAKGKVDGLVTKKLVN
jgi:hypothetical protein